MKYDACEVKATLLVFLSGAQQGVTTCQGLEANYTFSILHLFLSYRNWQQSPRICLLQPGSTVQLFSAPFLHRYRLLLHKVLQAERRITAGDAVFKCLMLPIKSTTATGGIRGLGHDPKLCRAHIELQTLQRGELVILYALENSLYAPWRSVLNALDMLSFKPSLEKRCFPM